ncbi:CCR4-NOT transcription complex subunit 6-like isoform X2 [Anthonomus grandis grandis]|nr:CCR4-NOT transcription complex subunit 6-like isoform X2 [Anthonomus grandis grandis]
MILGLVGNPLSKDIMTIYSEPNGTQKLLTFMLDNLQVTTPSPPPRPWIPLARPTNNRPACIFTVMCYNVLCDKYATRQMYSYCPTWALNWDYRKKGILEEIQHYSADIINLQEVEMDQFYNFFMPELKAQGYNGIYSPKSRAKHMAESERKYVDGCAIFYRTSKFTLVKEHLVEFNQLAMASADGLEHMLNRVMPKDNIGLAALLQTTESAWDNASPDAQYISQPILVCTAHIHWDPEFCDVKLIQTMMLGNELKTILDESVQTLRSNNMNINDPNNIQVVLCGDFNSLPDSGVIEFLSTGRVSQDHKDFKALSYKSCLEKVLSCDKPNEFTHSFKLASAYNDEIMPFTNYTFEFKGIIDYIFYAKNSMTPLGLLGPISQDWITQNKVIGCPHPHVYSDHFPLLVELEMVPTISGPMNGIIR